MKNNPSKVDTISKLRPLLTGLLMIAFLSSFFGFSMSPERKMAFKIMNQLGKNFEKKYGLRLAGCSEAAPKGNYENLGLELYSKKILTKNQGRFILIECAKELLNAINSTPQFRKYMQVYPFDGNNIVINIYNRGPGNSDLYYPDISCFSIFNNKLNYHTYTPQSRKRFQYFSIEKETLEEAMKIVEAQRKNSSNS